MSKKTRKTPSVHRQVVSHISSQLPCGACMGCLKNAVDRSLDAIAYRKSMIGDCYAQLKDVAATYAEKSGDAATVGVLADVIATRMRMPVFECLNSALQIMNYEMVPVPANGQAFIVRLVA